MKTNNRNEILEATIGELRKEWKNGEWNTVYSFKDYLNIQINHNKIKIVDPEISEKK